MLKVLGCAKRKELSFLEAETFMITAQDKEVLFVISAVYRPPDKGIKAFLDELEYTLQKLDKHDNVILVGDSNIDILFPNKFCVPDFLTITSGYGFEHQILGFTREEPYGTGLTRCCIDLINVRNPDKNVISGIITQKVADHYFVTISIRHGHCSLDRMQSGPKYVQ